MGCCGTPICETGLLEMERRCRNGFDGVCKVRIDLSKGRLGGEIGSKMVETRFEDLWTPC